MVQMPKSNFRCLINLPSWVPRLAVEMYQLAFHENYSRTNLLDRDCYLFVTVDSANICVIVLLYIGLYFYRFFCCIWTYAFILVFFFSDKLYKEIRDLNFEVVVQVHSTAFNFCLFMWRGFVVTFVVFVIPAIVIAISNSSLFSYIYQLSSFLPILNYCKLYRLQVLRQKATSIQQDYAEVKSTNVRIKCVVLCPVSSMSVVTCSIVQKQGCKCWVIACFKYMPPFSDDLLI